MPFERLNIESGNGVGVNPNISKAQKLKYTLFFLYYIFQFYARLKKFGERCFISAKGTNLNKNGIRTTFAEWAQFLRLKLVWN